MVTKSKTVSVAELKASLASSDFYTQLSAIEVYSKGQPSVDALAILRKALKHKDDAIVRCAADALAKLGVDAIPAVGELFVAARTTDESGVPQAYPECVRALAAIIPDDEDILDLVSHWAGVTNWEIVSAGMATLQKIGTPKALSLLKRIYTFWYNDLNKTQQKQADKFVLPLKGK
jgi:hypothetical protein